MRATSRFYFLLRKNIETDFLKSKKCARDLPFFTFHYIIFYCRNANRSINPSGVNKHSAEAVKLMEEADVPLEGPYDCTDLEKFQKIIPDFKINVWEAASPLEQPKLYFKGDAEASKTIMLFLDKQHFSVITDIVKFFGFTYFLPCCQKFYNSLWAVKHHNNGGLPCRKNHAEILPRY